MKIVKMTDVRLNVWRVDMDASQPGLVRQGLLRDLPRAMR